MSKQTDPASFESRFERLAGDRYFTAPWITRALIDVYGQQINRVCERGSAVWEPACGRGDVVEELMNYGLWCLATDVDVSEFKLDVLDDRLTGCGCYDFLKYDLKDIVCGPANIGAIVTNPPYKKNMHEKFIRRALRYLDDDDDDVQIVAMLLPSDFSSAAGRYDLFEERDDYAVEIRLCRRPFWDWWLTEAQLVERDAAYQERYGKKPSRSPRKHFSWFVWDKSTAAPRRQQRFVR